MRNTVVPGPHIPTHFIFFFPPPPLAFFPCPVFNKNHEGIIAHALKPPSFLKYDAQTEKAKINILWVFNSCYLQKFKMKPLKLSLDEMGSEIPLHVGIPLVKIMTTNDGLSHRGYVYLGNICTFMMVLSIRVLKKCK